MVSVQVRQRHLPSVYGDCGIVLALVGRLYPMVMKSNADEGDDDSDGTTQKSRICKSLVIFVGINHLCAVSSRATTQRLDPNRCVVVLIENSLSK